MYRKGHPANVPEGIIPNFPCPLARLKTDSTEKETSQWPRQPDKSHFLDAQPGETQWIMIFRDWIIWLDITACEKILSLPPKTTAVFCTTFVWHGPLMGPQGITHLRCHLIPLYTKDSVIHTDAPGCKLWEVRGVSLPLLCFPSSGSENFCEEQNG